MSSRVSVKNNRSSRATAIRFRPIVGGLVLSFAGALVGCGPRL